MMLMTLRNSIVEKLIENKLIEAEKLEELLAFEEESPLTLDRILISKGKLDDAQVLKLFAETLGLDFVEDLSMLSVPVEFVSNVPVGFARNYGIVAIGKADGRFRVATSGPLDLHAVDEVAYALKSEVDVVLATRNEVTALVNRGYAKNTDMVDETLDELSESDILGLASELPETEDLLDIAHKAPIIKLVNMIMFQALKMRASDIHIQPYEEKVQIRYRIDGILYDELSIPKKVQEAIISRIKVMGKMDIAERRLPQDGGCTLHVGNAEVDIRISSVPTSYGERIVMRLLDRSARRYSLEELGLSPDDHVKTGQLIRFSHGIILVTGPTGSGKTTTLYAALSRINASEKNILTIEDPIEYQLDGISQIEVSQKKGLTFASGLRSLVRQDPDVIMVGEIRDMETASIAIQSSLTGHLVFSTLHTNDAVSAITRLIDLGVEPYLVSSSVLAVFAQRLVRLICPHCRISYDATSEEAAALGIDFDEIPDGKLWKGTGCDKCFSTGYYDRTAIFELLVLDDDVRDLVMQKASSAKIKSVALKAGMNTLRRDGARNVVAGKTTVEEVLRTTQVDIIL